VWTCPYCHSNKYPYCLISVICASLIYDQQRTHEAEFLRKLRVSHLIKKFSTLSGIWIFSAMPKRICHWTISKTRIQPLVKIFTPALCEKTQVSLTLHEAMDGITIPYVLILYIFGQKTDRYKISNRMTESKPHINWTHIITCSSVTTPGNLTEYFIYAAICSIFRELIRSKIYK